MPDTLNKQTLINLLIDSPLREPIKINLIDIANNTSEPDLPKIYSTIVKELEIFQKATERRMKLADETIAKLGGTADTADAPTTNPASTPAAPYPTPTPTPDPTPVDDSTTPTPPISSTPSPLSVPPLDLPPLPSVPTPTPTPDTAPTPTSAPSPEPAPTASTPLEPLGGSVSSPSSDEAALAEIQKELESLKAGVAADATQTTNPAPTPTPAPQS